VDNYLIDNNDSIVLPPTIKEEIYYEKEAGEF